MPVSLIVSFTAALVLFLTGAQSVGSQEQKSLNRSAVQGVRAQQVELAKLRSEAIEKMLQSRSRSEKLLALYEEEIGRFREEYQKRRTFYEQGLIARSEMVQAEVTLRNALARAQEVKRWILEDEIAITEATVRDELLRLPGPGRGGYSDNSVLVRFNGPTLWSLQDAPKVQRFFTQTFGRALPISAFGQTPVHDRLRFDHHDAMDVALHPESDEGRSLIAFLRKAGIPFIAFKNAVPGAATGAHIHIGKPSLKDTPR